MADEIKVGQRWQDKQIPAEICRVTKVKYDQGGDSKFFVNQGRVEAAWNDGGYAEMPMDYFVTWYQLVEDV